MLTPRAPVQAFLRAVPHRVVSRALPRSGHVPFTVVRAAATASDPSTNKYDHKGVEGKWQKYWEDNQTFKVSTLITLGHIHSYQMQCSPMVQHSL